MNSDLFPRWRLIAAVATSLLLGVTVIQAADRTWTGGDNDWVDEGFLIYWTPFDEPDSDDAAVFNTSNSVNLGSGNGVNGLALSEGIDLSLNGFDLDVNGTVQVTGDMTSLLVPTGSLLQANDVDLQGITGISTITLSGGVLQLQSGLMQIGELNNNTQFQFRSVLDGFGDVELADVGGGVLRLRNDGAIVANGILTISDPGSAGGTVDLDGSTGRGVLDVHDEFSLFSLTRLTVSSPLADSVFNGTIFLGNFGVLEIINAWSLGDGAMLEVLDTGPVQGRLPATLRGGAITQLAGSSITVAADSALIFDAPFRMTGGDLANSGTVLFNANSTIEASANFTMPTNHSSIAVDPDAVVNIDQPNFNVDGNGAPENRITIRAGGVLDLDLGTGGDEGIGAVVVLLGGELDVTTTESDHWSLDGLGSVVVNSNTGTSQINGERVFVSNPVTIGSNATLDFNAPVTWQTGSSIAVGTNAVVRMVADVVFNGDGAYSGAGQIRIEGSSTWAASTTLDVLTQFLPASDATIDAGVEVTVEDSVVVFGGATFTGGGNLRSAEGGFMNLVGASTDIDVRVVNGGFIGLSDSQTPASPVLKSYRQESTGRLSLAVDPTGADTDLFRVTGLAELDGELLWTLPTAASRLPGPNEVFTVLTAGSITGTFANAPNGSRLQDAFFGAGSFVVNYTSTSVLLSDFIAAGPAYTGDFDEDGDVDAADYVVWRNGLGTTYTQDHYNTWRANFGRTAGSGATVGLLNGGDAAVPEPATLVLLILAAAGVATRRR